MKYLFTLLALSLSLTTLAQTKNSFFEKGNKLLNKKDYKGAKEALAFFQKSNEADLKNKFDAVSTHLFSEQINRTKQFQINDFSLIGSAYSNLLALIIFFNIIFPLIYFFLLKSFLKQ